MELKNDFPNFLRHFINSFLFIFLLSSLFLFCFFGKKGKDVGKKGEKRKKIKVRGKNDLFHGSNNSKSSFAQFLWVFEGILFCFFSDAKCFYKDGILIKIHHKLKKEIYIYLFIFCCCCWWQNHKNKNPIIKDMNPIACFCVLEAGRIPWAIFTWKTFFSSFFLCVFPWKNPLESMLSCFLHLIDNIRFS